MNKLKLVSVAIDFGTTFSGYSYQYKRDVERRPWAIYCTQFQNGVRVSHKTPTIVLLKKDSTGQKECIFFGSDAEKEYTTMKKAGIPLNKYNLVKHFKMELHSTERLHEDMLIDDVTGAPVSAMSVFSCAIKYLSEHALKRIQKNTPAVELEDLRFLLTVPAIWQQSAKQFMRRAAEQAGIATENLTLVLEPEAASVYCTQMPLEMRQDHTGSDLTEIKEDTVYLLVDAGGGTVDCTVHRVRKHGVLKEIMKPSGGPWGGQNVNHNYFRFLEDVFTASVMTQFKMKHPDLFLRMEQEFELQKVSFKGLNFTQHQFCYFQIPEVLLKIHRKITALNKEDILQNRDVCWSMDSLGIRQTRFMSFYWETLERISQHVKFLHDKVSEKHTISYIFLAGGYSESEILQQKIIRMFPKVKVIIPPEPQLAIIKGAILFGCDPKIICSRIARLTYGVEHSAKFREGDDPEKMEVINGHKWSPEKIFTLVHRGEVVLTGEALGPFVFEPARPNQDLMELPFFSAESRKPKTIKDNGVKQVGELMVDLPPRRHGDDGMDRRVAVSVIPGDTEMKVVATELASGRKCEARLDFLSRTANVADN